MSAPKTVFMPRSFKLALLAASLLNILPLLIFPLGGDTVFHRILADCFSSQFWQGDLYPRWCMDSNAGLGAPFFIFYFPLGYYVQALLSPLEHMGIPPMTVYALNMYLATLLTGITAYAWLKDIVTPGRALLAAILFLFIPYRMEVMLFRAGYAEIWALAFMPLVFRYARRLALGVPYSTLKLAGYGALLMLAHAPIAIITFAFAGLWVLLMAQTRPRAVAFFAIASGWAGMMAAFYLIPAAYFRRFMLPVERTTINSAWANTFFSFQNLEGQPRVSIAIALALLLLLALCISAVLRLRRMQDSWVKRETTAWISLALLSVFLLLPVSSSFYVAAGGLAQYAFPWRMQGIFSLGIVYLLALHMQYFRSQRQLHNWKWDYGMLLGLLALLAYFVFGVANPDSEKTSSQLIAARAVPQPEYQPLGVPARTFTKESILQRYTSGKMPQAEIISPRGGAVQVEHWGTDKIVLMVDKEDYSPVRIGQFYMPIWEAKLANGRELAVHPDPMSGQLAVEVPRGRNIVTLQYSISSPAPNLIRGAYAVSLAGWIMLAMGIVLWRRRAARDCTS